jgi:6-phosphogluconate dehydrogenase
MKNKEKKVRMIIKQATASRIPVAGFSSALAYFDAYCSSQLPTNLIQAHAISLVLICISELIRRNVS